MKYGKDLFWALVAKLLWVCFFERYATIRSIHRPKILGFDCLANRFGGI